jgi:phthalate 4,5-cis-dihydrodiol dehydrogenase
MAVGGAVLRIGIAGFGVAARQILPAFGTFDGARLAAVADVRRDELERARERFGVATFTDVEAMCASPKVDAVWIATPNALHAAHVVAAAEHGKHVICEKPMALTLEECDRMIAACDRAGVRYVQGHSKLYDRPIRVMREIVASGELGRVLQVDTWNFNDWLLRPRLASEVDTSQGGGVVYRQAPHQVDIVRYLAGGLAETVSASVTRAEPALPTEGGYSAFVRFAGGAAATLSFNGYGHFAATELTWGIGEGGLPEPAPTGPRARPAGPLSADAKYALPAYAHTEDRPGERRQPFFGVTIVSCERGVIRQSPDSVTVHADSGRREVTLPAVRARGSELRELVDAIREDRDPFPGARWGKATLEVCLAILDSARQRGEVRLAHQCAVP